MPLTRSVCRLAWIYHWTGTGQQHIMTEAPTTTAPTTSHEPVPVRKPGEKLVPPPGMTKSAYKKLLRKQRHEATKDQYRQHRKELKKSRDVERRAEIERLKASGEPYEHLLKTRNRNKLVKSFSLGKDSEMIDVDGMDEAKKIKVIIDCAYDDYMNEKEVVSLSSQVTRAYSSNRQAVKKWYTEAIERKQKELTTGEKVEEPQCELAPACKLAISGVDKRLKKRFDDVLSDYQKWDPECAVLTSDPIEKALANVGASEDYDNVVYLSADVEEKLEVLTPGEIYLVGGIVDKGRHKNLCKSTAERLGKKIRILRLPIDEYIQLSGRKVLTTAHVVELLLKWCEYKDWKKAFEEVLPARKMKEGAEADEDDDDEDDE
jgi:tRNA (guanine9-N1)-methyltransferase